jgi:hypothetical protein
MMPRIPLEFRKTEILLATRSAILRKRVQHFRQQSFHFGEMEYYQRKKEMIYGV